MFFSLTYSLALALGFSMCFYFSSSQLTPEKFDLLVDQVIELQISNANLLRDVVSAVFEKALAEPNYSHVYAEFCVRLSIKLPSFPADENDTQNTINFKRLVLNRCQQEFEKSEKGDDEKTESMNEEEKTEYRAKMKRRTLGTIRFIGEMFVRKVLSSKILNRCIIMLIGDAANPVEEDLEQLAKLLETVGKAWDTKANADFVISVFESIAALSQDKSLSSRIRFMLLDSIELRSRDWIARRKTESAVKLSEVHKESAVKEAPVKPVPTPTGAGANRGKRPDRPGQAASPRKRSEDLWETVGAINRGNKKGSQDIRNTGKSSGAPSTNLARSNSSAANNNANKNASERKTADGDREAVGAQGAFALLNDDDHEHDEDAEADNDDGELDGDDAGNTDVDLEALQEKFSSLIADYLNHHDVKEAAECVREINNFTAGTEIFFKVIMDGQIELNNSKREASFPVLVKLLVHFVEQSLLTVDTLTESISFFLKGSHAVCSDFPLVFDLTGHFVGALIFHKVLCLNSITGAFADKLKEDLESDEYEPDSEAPIKLAIGAFAKLKQLDAANYLQNIKSANLKWDNLADMKDIKREFTKKCPDVVALLP